MVNDKYMLVCGRAKGSGRQGGAGVQGGRVVGGGRVVAGGGVNSMNERGTVPLSVLGPGASSQRAPRLRVRRRSAA